MHNEFPPILYPKSEANFADAIASLFFELGIYDQGTTLEIIHRYDQGLSGARVYLVKYKNGGCEKRCVVKVGDASQLADEAERVKLFIKHDPNIHFFARVIDPEKSGAYLENIHGNVLGALAYPDVASDFLVEGAMSLNDLLKTSLELKEQSAISGVAAVLNVVGSSFASLYQSKSERSWKYVSRYYQGSIPSLQCLGRRFRAISLSGCGFSRRTRGGAL